MNEELDSQLSAMFDNELPAAECELLARRLSRDEQLKARWGRYAVMGAAIRAERGVRLNAALASRVSAAISSEPVLTAEPTAQPRKRWQYRVWQPVASAAAVAGVAALAIFWMRAHAPDTVTMASVDGSKATDSVLGSTNIVSGPVAPTPVVNTGEPDSYVVPKNASRRLVVPSTELANYVVAHSEFSSPVTRRNLLSAFMASESAPEPTTAGTSAGSDQEPIEDVQDDAKNPQ
jgi:sigma-E factor negative regulatory protein RseA